MTASNMTHYEAVAWVRLAKSGELGRYLAMSSSSDNSRLYLDRLRALAASLDADERGQA